MVKKIQDNLTNIVVVLGLIASIGAGFTKFANMQSSIDQLEQASKSVDVASIGVVTKNSETISTNSFTLNDHQTSIAILQKEIEVLKLEISEIKENNKNPLQ